LIDLNVGTFGPSQLFQRFPKRSVAALSLAIVGAQIHEHADASLCPQWLRVSSKRGKCAPAQKG
jgi:hypothetical protein